MSRHHIGLALSAAHLTSILEIASYIFSDVESSSTKMSGWKNEMAFSLGVQSLCLVPEAWIFRAVTPNYATEKDLKQMHCVFSVLSSF